MEGRPKRLTTGDYADDEAVAVDLMRQLAEAMMENENLDTKLQNKTKELGEKSARLDESTREIERLSENCEAYRISVERGQDLIARNKLDIHNLQMAYKEKAELHRSSQDLTAKQEQVIQKLQVEYEETRESYWSSQELLAKQEQDIQMLQMEYECKITRAQRLTGFQRRISCILGFMLALCCTSWLLFNSSKNGIRLSLEQATCDNFTHATNMMETLYTEDIAERTIQEWQDDHNITKDYLDDAQIQGESLRPEPTISAGFLWWQASGLFLGIFVIICSAIVRSHMKGAKIDSVHKFTPVFGESKR